MSDSLYLVYPLLAAIVYASGAYLLKAAQQRGMSSIQATMWTIFFTGGVFILGVYPWWHDPLIGPASWLHSFFLGLMFFIGLMATVIAIEKGDVSVATPMLGSKVILVAFLDAGFAQGRLDWTTWLAASLTTLGVILLARGGKKQSKGSIILGLVLAFIAALCFATFDVMVAVWTPTDGAERLVPVGMFLAIVMSMLTMLAIRQNPLRLPARGRILLLAGAILIAIQSAILIWALGEFSDYPTAINVVYSSRGIWSVLLVGGLSLHIKSVETFESRGIFVSRLIGAGVIVGAIVVLVAA